MMLAELRGKVSSRVRGSEDVLTSYAFGVCEALDPGELLVPWSASAARLDGQRLGLAATRAAYEFWPALDLVGADVEPDVLVTLWDGAGVATLVLFEAKFRSGPSGWPTGPDVDEVTGQLGRQWLALNALAPHEAPGAPHAISRRVIVYLTADARRPDFVLERMAHEVAKAGHSSEDFRSALYWLSWRELSLRLRRPRGGPARTTAVLAARLDSVLADRALACFGGSNEPEAGPLPWRYESRPYALRPPAAQRLPWTYRSR
jgi:hypothetical protein